MPEEKKPDTRIWWRTYALCRIRPRIRVQIQIGEPMSEQWYHDPQSVTEQSVTLARLGRMLRKLSA